jgi:hypothetical protein
MSGINSAKPAFSTAKPVIYSSDYITRKKIKMQECYATSCKNKLLFDDFNKTNMHINLYTKLDVSEVHPIISDFSGDSPVIIERNPLTQVSYTIDADGLLFGNTPCGINNFVHYLVYNGNK